MSLFLIDLGEPVVFVHLPKTGGRSIREGRTLAGPRFGDAGDWESSAPPFAVLRNPYERLASAWRDFRYARKLTDMDFGPFLRWARIAQHSDRAENPGTMEHHIASVLHPVHGFDSVRCFLDFENLAEDFDLYCRAHGLRAPELGWVGRTSSLADTPWTEPLRREVRSGWPDEIAVWESSLRRAS